MHIKLGMYDIERALMNYIQEKMQSTLDWVHDDSYVELSVEIQQPVEEQLKHKNGKVMKTEYGQPLCKVVGWETKSFSLDDGSEIEIYIEPNMGDPKETS
tara:strand:+ start:245 stop:544 length:300 start_codon:yes stop_codon:yes gene_type:complete